MVGDDVRRLLVENNREIFLNAENKAMRIIRTNGNFDIRKDVECIEFLKERLLIDGKKDKELYKYVDYWNLVLYYLRKIIHENDLTIIKNCIQY